MSRRHQEYDTMWAAIIGFSIGIVTMALFHKEDEIRYMEEGVYEYINAPERYTIDTISHNDTIIYVPSRMK